MFGRRPFLLAIVVVVSVQMWPARLRGQQNPQASSTQDVPRPALPEETPIALPPTEPQVDPSVALIPAVIFPNYASCPITELRHAVPELAHLKPAQDQTELFPLLSKIGGALKEIAGKMPNLISHEAVTSDRNGVKSHQNFSYLVLQHTQGGRVRVLDEFRVDLASGEKFQTESIEKAVAATSNSLDLPPTIGALPKPESGPRSQGFVNNWLRFYPSNLIESDFRYLGQQKMDGRPTMVVVFAQKPGSVRMPGKVGFGNKIYPVFMQGIAWVDASNFRIVRLRTDLLTVPAGVPLRRLTADIEFTQIRIAEVASPLWLPRQVIVVSNVAGAVLRESHTYSDYRLFRTHSKILLNP